jgi:hypothetical protein
LPRCAMALRACPSFPEHTAALPRQIGGGFRGKTRNQMLAEKGKDGGNCRFSDTLNMAAGA